jgi:hypothetical protein
MADPTTPDRRLVLGVVWSGEHAEVRLRDDDETTSRLVPLIGLKLNYRASGDSVRRCLGRTPFRKAEAAHTDCPNPPEVRGRLCRSCAASDATFASNLHHAHTKDRATIDPAVAEHLRQPNLLYLAAFRDGSIKVGTTTQKRSLKRLTEQGAWRAVFVALAGDGYAIRDLEDRVTVELGIPQSVSMARKLWGMSSPLPDEMVVARLGERAGLVGGLVEGMDESRMNPHSEAWSFPNSKDPVWSGLHRYPLDLSSGQHNLQLAGACGRMVVITRALSNDVFVADIGQLYGIELEMGEYEPDDLVVQDSLF